MKKVLILAWDHANKNEACLKFLQNPMVQNKNVFIELGYPIDEAISRKQEQLPYFSQTPAVQQSMRNQIYFYSHLSRVIPVDNPCFLPTDDGCRETYMAEKVIEQAKEGLNIFIVGPIHISAIKQKFEQAGLETQVAYLLPDHNIKMLAQGREFFNISFGNENLFECAADLLANLRLSHSELAEQQPAEQVDGDEAFSWGQVSCVFLSAAVMAGVAAAVTLANSF